MFLLYEVLLYLVLIVGFPVFLVTGILRGKYISSLPERLGLHRGRPAPHDLWIHAVSVGETLAARPLVDAVLEQRPGTSMVFTTTTITGQAQARREFPSATVTYFPFDFTFSVWRFLQHHQPRVHVSMETEIWPNVVRLSSKRNVRLILANGRISDRSYPRYRAVRFALRRILRGYDRIMVREEIDRQRFIAIGAPEEIVETIGNVKFDHTPDLWPLEIAGELEALVNGRRVAVLGSTMEGEDEALIPQIQQIQQINDGGEGRSFFFIIAPRKQERFDPVARLLARSGLRFLRRTELTRMAPAEAEVLLLDSFGELARIYRYASVAFIGGSLEPTGGHNPIEPAAAGVPVCFGPSMTNFRDIASVLLGGGAAKEVPSAAEAGEFLRAMLCDENLAAEWGERGRRVVEANRGASARTAHRIVELLA